MEDSNLAVLQLPYVQEKTAKNWPTPDETNKSVRLPFDATSVSYWAIPCSLLFLRSVFLVRFSFLDPLPFVTSNPSTRFPYFCTFPRNALIPFAEQRIYNEFSKVLSAFKSKVRNLLKKTRPDVFTILLSTYTQYNKNVYREKLFVICS